MYIIYGLISGILSSVLSSYIGYRICKREIVIKHNLNPFYWFWVHFLVSIFTVMLMAFSDFVYENFADVKNLPLGWKGIICAFIQNGGLLVIVMLISSLIYNYFVQAIEFNYFVERHPWIKKLFFSMAGITLIIMYIFVIGNSQDDINILADEYKPVVVWGIVVIEIWVGFGMQVSIPHLNTLKNWKRENKERDEKQVKNEKKYIFWCVVSMLLCPMFMIFFLFTDEYMPNSVQKNLHAIFCGLVIGSLTMIAILYVFNFINFPNKKRSIKNFKKNFKQMKNALYIGHFMRVEYELKKDKNKLVLHIYQQNIKIEERKEYSKSFLTKFDKAFGERTEIYLFEQHEMEKIQTKIEHILEQTSNEREELLKKGWNIAYKLCADKEKQKSDMIK